MIEKGIVGNNVNPALEQFSERTIALESRLFATQSASASAVGFRKRSRLPQAQSASASAVGFRDRSIAGSVPTCQSGEFIGNYSLLFDVQAR
jgi:hypothetical protein